MHFSTKSYLKSTRNHTVKQALSLVTSSTFGILAPVMNGFCFSTLKFEKKTLEQMKMDINGRFCMDLCLENTLTSRGASKLTRTPTLN